jgi:hypothetical protein
MNIIIFKFIIFVENYLYAYSFNVFWNNYSDVLCTEKT